MSAVETAASTAIGLMVAYCTQVLVFPLFGIEIPHSSHVAITAIFTAASVVRSYLVRRLFNRLKEIR
jgi:hypothetical protein